ncbi:MAG: NAD-dependent succinate-semialdehyde dehydrogenase [Cytophagaceae bacterium]
MSIKSINPHTNALLKEYSNYGSAALDIVLMQGEEAFFEWRSMGFNSRRQCMLKCSEYLTEYKTSLAKIIVSEMGKPISEALAEVEKCAWVCEYYAVMAQDFLKDEYRESDATESFISHEPLGIILAIMPWNFPFWQVFRFAAPTLMAGNTAILKHASNVPQCALAIEEIFKNSGFPDNVFQSVLIDNETTEYLLKSDKVKAVSLTGSEYAGSQVAQIAGKYIKKAVLELGGSDAFIVLEDADLQLASDVAVKSRLQNCGQSCIAAKRFIVVDSVYDKFLSLVMEKASNYIPGDPTDEKTNLGPMAREDLAQSLIRQVNTSISNGAVLEWGGGRPNLPGSYVNPAILTNVKPGTPAYDEELFGPVFSFIKVKDENEAIIVGNDSRYGLGSSLWTENIPRAIALSRKIDAGAVFINGIVKSDPRLPFGGIKKSGYGRELSELGIKEFVNAKTIWVK